MSKFIVNGSTYDVAQAIEHPPIGAVNELREEFGILPSAIRKQFEQLGPTIRTEGFDADEFIYSEDFQKALFGLIFLGKRRAGEKVTLQEVKDEVALLAFTDIDFVVDEVVPGPKAPTNSGQVDGDVPAPTVTSS